MTTKPKLILEPVENLTNSLKRTAWTSIAESLLLILIGIFLVINPTAVTKVVTYIIGAFFLVVGLYQLISYFVSKGYKNFFNNNLLRGTILLAVGIAVLLIGEEIANILRVCLGILVLYSALLRLNTAIKLAAAKVKNWFLPMIFSLIILVLGIFLTFYSGSALIFAGWIMISSGIFSIISDIFFISDIDALVAAMKQ